MNCSHKNNCSPALQVCSICRRFLQFLIHTNQQKYSCTILLLTSQELDLIFKAQPCCQRVSMKNSAFLVSCIDCRVSLVCICMCNVSSLIKGNLKQLWTNTLLAIIPCVLTFGFTTWHSLPFWLSCSKPVQLGNGL